jgi:hypothetical protein
MELSWDEFLLVGWKVEKKEKWLACWMVALTDKVLAVM